MCLLSASADTNKAFTEFGSFLLIYIPKPCLWFSGTLLDDHSVLLQDLSDVRGCKCSSWTGTERGHQELLSWLLISSPMPCNGVFCSENPSIFLPFGSLMLADGNPAQLSKTLNNLLSTKLLGLRAGSFSFSPFFFSANCLSEAKFLITGQRSRFNQQSPWCSITVLFIHLN